MFIVKDVQEAMAKISNIFYRSYETFEKDKFNEPVIGESSDIANNAIIENGAIIGKNVKISSGAIIKCNCIIGDDSKIGANSVIENSILGGKQRHTSRLKRQIDKAAKPPFFKTKRRGPPSPASPTELSGPLSTRK